MERRKDCRIVGTGMRIQTRVELPTEYVCLRGDDGVLEVTHPLLGEQQRPIRLCFVCTPEDGILEVPEARAAADRLVAAICGDDDDDGSVN